MGVAAEEQEEEEYKYACPVCDERFRAGNQLQYHYDEKHSVRDPEVATSIAHQCPHCKGYLGKFVSYHLPECPARLELRNRLQAVEGRWLPVMYGVPRAQPRAWHIATDGSGKETGGDRLQRKAGWGAVVFRDEGNGDISLFPDYVLHAPVVTQAWDHRWIGARDKTNNTAEITAIGEVMLWLEEEAPDDGTVPVLMRYDSYYAANIARGIWQAKSNEELAHAVRELTEKMAQKRSITWSHVYGHQGYHDNEMAERAADDGCEGRVPAQSRRWTAPSLHLARETIR